MRRTNLGCKLNFPKSCSRKNHKTLSNVFIMSSLRMQLWPRAFLLMDPTSSCARRMFFAMSHPGTKADCSGEMRADKEYSQSVNENLGKDLVSEGAQTNRPKVCEGGGVRFLRDQDNEGTYALWDWGSHHEVFGCLQDIIDDNIPTVSEESSRETIRTRSAIAIQSKHHLSHFFKGSRPPIIG